MVVRSYVNEDFGAVCRIYADAKRAELQFEDGSFDIKPLEHDARILAALKESDVLVFEIDTVVGFAAVHGATLRALFVHGDVCGTGVGTALLRSVLGRTPDPVLNVAKSNLPARRFYEKHGFVAAGTSLSQYDGKSIEYVTMNYEPPSGMDITSDTGHGLPGGRQ